MIKFEYNRCQLFGLVALRVAIGWHFLYEGIAKLMSSNWSSLPFLLDSKGFLAKTFYAMAANPSLVKIIDQLNIWGLIAIGLGLILGCLTRPAIISGIILLLLYYFSHPPLAIVKYSMPSEGSYIYVNKNLIEAIALWVLLVFPTSHIIGLDRLLFKICCKSNDNTSCCR